MAPQVGFEPTTPYLEDIPALSAVLRAWLSSRKCIVIAWAALIAYPSIPRSFAAVPPRILIRSSSLRPGIDMIWSTGAVFHGNG